MRVARVAVDDERIIRLWSATTFAVVEAVDAGRAIVVGTAAWLNRMVQAFFAAPAEDHAMRFHFNGDKIPGKIDLKPIQPGCGIFVNNQDQPVGEDDLPHALGTIMIRWMKETNAQVKHTLPIVQGGNTIAIVVWWEPGQSPA